MYAFPSFGACGTFLLLRLRSAHRSRHFNVWNGVPREDRKVFIRIIFRGPVSQVFETS